MDPQFLAALQSLTFTVFNSLFPEPIAGRLYERYVMAKEGNELQLWLLSLTDQQQLEVKNWITTFLHSTVVEMQGKEDDLKAFRDWMLETNLHFIIKNDPVIKPDRTGYADWSIVTDAVNYKSWLKYHKHKAA